MRLVAFVVLIFIVLTVYVMGERHGISFAAKEARSIQASQARAAAMSNGPFITSLYDGKVWYHGVNCK